VSEARPFYGKTRERRTSRLWTITCDEGWRTMIVATGMTAEVADWIIGQIQGKPMPHVTRGGTEIIKPEKEYL
jgi:hypothetical protein